MSLLFIDFEWWKDAKGYHLAEAEPAEASKSTKHPIFGFDVEATLLESVGRPQRVVPNGGTRLAYRPLNNFGELYKAFASLQTPQEVLFFIRNYGPLTEAGLQPNRGQEIPYVLEHAEAFRGWLNANRGRRKKLATSIANDGKKFANLEARLTADASGTIQLRILPQTLLGALWVQLAQALAGGLKIRACLHCGQWFEAGAGTDRRLDAKFCSDVHRVLFNSLKRTKGR